MTSVNSSATRWRYTPLASLLVLLFACSDPLGPGAAHTLPPVYAAAPLVPVDSAKGLQYTAADGSTMTYDVYWARTAPAQNARSVVWVAGGGWQNVGLESPASDYYPLRIARQINGKVYMPRYHVGITDAAGKQVWPAQVEDVRCFIRFIRYNSVAQGIDKLLIDGAGHSAGAHIVALIGRDAEGASTCYQGTTSGLRRVLPFAPPANLVKLSGFSADAQAFIPKVFGDSVARRLASPALTGGPCSPMFIFHGVDDKSVNVSNGIELQAACAPWGAKLWKIPGCAHGMMCIKKSTVVGSVDKSSVLDSAVAFILKP